MTADLNGFRLQGQAGSLDGIHVNTGLYGVTIRNGAIIAARGDGIDAADVVSQMRIERITVNGCTGQGIIVGNSDFLGAPSRRPLMAARSGLGEPLLSPERIHLRPIDAGIGRIAASTGRRPRSSSIPRIGGRTSFRVMGQVMRAPLAIVALASVSCLGQPCEPEWGDLFPPSDVDGPVTTALLWDDPGVPGGPALYIGGGFERARHTVLNGGARWDGQAWAPLGDGPGDQNIRTMAAYDDDGDGPHPEKLYAAGDADRIYVWDGASWTMVYDGDDIFDMAVFDEDGPGPKRAALFAGSVRFSGGGWTNFTDQRIRAIEVFDPDGAGPEREALYYAGSFTEIGLQSIPAKGIARWTGDAWEEVGGGVEGEDGSNVFALHVADLDGLGGDGPGLYIGGNFDTAGGVTIPSIARWDGKAWSAYGATASVVHELSSFDPDGDGPQVAAVYIVVFGLIQWWDGVQWVKIATTFDDGALRMADFLLPVDLDGPGPGGDVLVTGGPFNRVDDIALDGIGLHDIMAWDGNAWSQIEPGNAPDLPVRVMLPFDEDGDGPDVPALFAGGDLHTAGSQLVRGIARWDGEEWSPLGGGFEREGDLAQVFALAAFDEDGPGPGDAALFAGGRFTIAEGMPVPGIARWGGHEWSGLAGGVDGIVQAMTVFDADGAGPGTPELYVGGDFSVVDGKAAENVARWDGFAWHSLPPLAWDVWSILVFDEDGPGPLPERLYVGTSSNVMRLEGDQWTMVGESIGGQGFFPGVRTMAAYDRDGGGPEIARLYIGGGFDIGSIQEWTNIAVWTGADWLGVGGGAGNVGPFSGVLSLVVHDDDADGPNPPSLFVGGSFYLVGDQPANHFARWDGTVWHVMPGMERARSVYGLTVFDEDRNGPKHPALFVGGYFEQVDGHSSWYIARWGCPPPPACYADCDGSGGLDLFDFLCFVNAFNAGENGAECNGDGEFDLFDFLCFTNAFNAGC